MFMQLRRDMKSKVGRAYRVQNPLRPFLTCVLLQVSCSHSQINTYSHACTNQVPEDVGAAGLEKCKVEKQDMRRAIHLLQSENISIPKLSGWRDQEKEQAQKR